MKGDDECIFCGKPLETNIDNILKCPICTEGLSRRRTNIPMDSVKENYETVYLALIKVRRDLNELEKSTKLTKNKDGFRKGLCAIETLIDYMESSKE